MVPREDSRSFTKNKFSERARVFLFFIYLTVNISELKFDLMKKADLPELLRLWKMCGLIIKDDILETYEVGLILQLWPACNFVIKSDNQIIGSVLGTFNGRSGWIYRLAVHPNWQKHGLGKSLLQKAESSLINCGASKVYLSVNCGNLKVLPFYEKYGYAVAKESVYMEKSF